MASRGRRPISPRASRAKSDATIRKAGPADRDRLAAIAEAAFAPYVAAIGRRPAPMDEDLGPALARGEGGVASVDDEVVGYAAYTLPHAPGEPATLDTIALEPFAQGRGIGAALIAAVESHARAAGVRVLALYTNAKMTANLSLYPALGFVETGRRAEAGFDRVFFEKALPPATVTRPAVDGLYGRRRGQSAARVPDRHPRLVDIAVPFDRENLFPGARVLRLEVGFGGGEHLLDHAAREPDIGLLGAEPFETGLARALARADELGLANLRFFGGDARRLIEWLPDAALERVDVLYPDPWHKQRHWKRRFISADGLDRLARVIAPGGTVRFASDIPGYVKWTRDHVAAHPAFSLVGDSDAPWSHWPGTRYEAKAFREGRTPRYLTLLRA